MRLMPHALILFYLASTAPAGAAVNFEKEILPVLEKKCFQCHQAPFEKEGKIVKPKAGLRLDAAWAIQKGSDNGAVVMAGAPEQSGMLHRVTLPRDDEDFMPPKDKAEPLAAAEIAVLEAWIEEGADFGEWQGNLEGKPASLSKSGKAITLSESQKLYQRLAEGLAMPEEKSWDSVKIVGGRVTRLAQTSPLLSVDFRHSQAEVKEEQILSARVIAANIAHLDLSRTAATDAALALASETPRLVRLDLSNTTIGDAGLAHLEGLKELRYLNLYQTQVTDAGLKLIAGLSSLESIYLWQSRVSEKGVKALQKALPGAKVNFK